ncbi:MAG: hypothetical protein WA364_26260 [Candidatus Nitrosopolaris sp.]
MIKIKFKDIVAAVAGAVIAIKMRHVNVYIHLSLLIAILAAAPTLAYATNEGSFISGFWSGSSTGPNNAPGQNANPSFDSNTCKLSSSDTSFTVKSEVIPAVTNTTACEDGWFTGYKNWCAKNSMDCVNNITQGIFPDFLVLISCQGR